jgi:hypothetical protein
MYLFKIILQFILKQKLICHCMYRKVDSKRQIVKQRIRCNIDGFLKICNSCNCISHEDGP